MTSDPCTPPGSSGYPSDCDILAAFRERSAHRSVTIEEPIRERSAAIRLVLLDIDGVLTDGSLVFSENGAETKLFNAQDGLGLKLLQQAGIELGLISGRPSEIVRQRAAELAISLVYLGTARKIDAYKDILQHTALKPFETCYMGDDWVDLAILTRVGLAACPANAVPEVRQVCHVITARPGGRGAVRELCDLIISAKGLRDSLLQHYMS